VSASSPIEWKFIDQSREMNNAVQIIVTPSGERLAVLPEEDYLMLLAASEDDDGEARPEFLEELRRRRRRIADDGALVPLDSLRGKPA
jgi:hypothetical protein